MSVDFPGSTVFDLVSKEAGVFLNVKRKYQLTMELTFRCQQSQNVNAAAGGGCIFFNPLYTNDFFPSGLIQ